MAGLFPSGPSPMGAALLARPQGSMTSYEPTWRDRARGMAAALVGDRAAEGFFGKGLIGDDTGLVDMTPAGFPLALDDIHRSGNKTNLAINTVAALPIPGARMLKDAVEPVVKKGIRAFHGTPQSGLTRIAANPPQRQYDNATSQFGAFFAPNKAGAQHYAGPSGRTYEADVPIANPYEMSWREFDYFQSPNKAADGSTAADWSGRAEELKQEAAALRERLKAEGHDGIVVRGGRNNDIKEIASFADVDVPSIRAFHGSPHDFDKFDMSKIGTGEGAQAYGHGLYFAENEGVAREYKNTLERSSRVSGVPISGLEGAAESYLYKAGGNVDTAIKEASDELARLRKSDKKIDSMRADGAQKAIVKLQAWKSTNAVAPAGAGRMYEASINASPDEFLDWDKPLSEQPAMMAKLGWTPEKVAEYRRLTKIHDDDLLAQLTNSSAVSTSAEAREAYEKARALVREIGFSPDQKGEAIARGGSVFDSAADAGKADKLRAAGIKGIRYKDAGSRVEPQELKVWRDAVATYKASGDPKLAAAEKRLAQLENEHGRTHNYVVFDSDIIEILRKYGIAGLIGGGATAASLGASTKAEAQPLDPSNTR